MIVNCNQYLLCMRHVKLLVFISLLLFVSRAKSQTYSDAPLESLMQTAQYAAAKQLATKKYAALTKSDYTKRLYYLNKQGMAVFKMGEFELSDKFAQSALNIIPKTTDSIVISETWQLKAYTSNRKGEFDTAVYYSKKLLRYAIAHKDDKKQGIALTSLATLLMQNGQYREALGYNIEANKLYRKTNDISLQTVSEYNIGLAYLNLKILDSSLYYLFKSLNTNKKSPKADLEVYILGTIADCYLFKKDTPLWKKYQLLTSEAAEKTGNQQFVSMGFSQLGQHELQESNFKSAYVYLIKAHNALVKQPFPMQQIKVDSLLYITTKLQKQYAAALQWHESYAQLQQKIFTTKQTASLNKAYAKIASYKKDKIILEKEQQLTKAKNKVAFLIFILIAFIAIVVLNYFYRNKLNNYKRHLFHKNKELDQQFYLSRLSFESLVAEKSGNNSNIDNINFANECGQKERSIELYQRLLDLLESEKIYLDPEVNAKTLENLLGTNKKYLYEAIKQCSGTNLRGLFNRYKVNNVKEMMEKAITSRSIFSLNQYSVSSGFNSSTSFYRVFRQYTGLTPSGYFFQLKKETRNSVR